MQIGTIVKPGDPNYALLDKATSTIQRFLDSFHSDAGQIHSDGDPAQGQGQGQGQHEESDDWAALLSQDLWDYEAGFWQCLADHPSLMAVDPPLPSV